MPKVAFRRGHCVRWVAAAAVGALAIAAGASGAGAALPAAKPFALRVAGNGLAIAVFDHAKGRLQDLWLQPYQALVAGQPTQDVLHDAYFGLRTPGAAGVWAPGLPLQGCAVGQVCTASSAVLGYPESAGVIAEKRSWDVNGKVTLQTMVWVPQTLQGRGVVLMAEVHNQSDSAKTIEVSLLFNAHLGAGAPQPASEPEQLVATGVRSLLESSPASDHRVWLQAVDGLAHSATATSAQTPISLETVNPFNKFVKAQPLGGQADSGVGADRVAGMLWQIQLAPGQKAAVAALALYQAGASAAVLAAQSDQFLQGRTPQQLLADELAWWQSWHAQAKEPAGLAGEALLLYRRSLMLLRMAQSRQPNASGPQDGAGTGLAPRGQIVASLPPGQWNITWPRDQAYAGVALAAAGRLDMAKAALEFVLRGKAGQYQAEVGGPYRVSVTRYWGGGTEESDINEFGPNIELDGFGLVLWQAGRYLQASADSEFLAQWWPVLRDLIAEPLRKSVDATGLVKPDSSIWEVHWNGQQKHFAYTSIAAVRGLCAAAQLATWAGEGKLAGQYRADAKALHQAIQTKLSDGKSYLRGNLEEAPGQAHDLAAVEAFLDGQLPPWGAVAQASWAAWLAKLAAGGGPGFFRNDDGGEYDSQEWLFIDLRVLRWLDRAVDAGAPLQAHRDALRQRVLEVAQQGGGIVPELLGTSGAAAGQFAGAVPMMGFGAGAAVLALGGAAMDDDLEACLQAGTAVVADPGPDAGGGDATAADLEVALALDGEGDGVALADVPAGSDAAAGSDAGELSAAVGDVPAAGQDSLADNLLNDKLINSKDGAARPAPARLPADSGCAAGFGADRRGLWSVLGLVAGWWARRRSKHG